MRGDLEKRLFEDFPDLYCRHFEPGQWHPFHVACPNGWEPLLRRLSERITQIVQSLPLEPSTPVEKSSISEVKAGQYAGLTARSFCVDQVKEKFGGLRFYMNHSTEEIRRAIHEAEKESLMTCETCGRMGKLRGRSWYFVACDEHNSEEEEAIEFLVQEVSLGGKQTE
jgi:hypothetical protein